MSNITRRKTKYYKECRKAPSFSYGDIRHKVEVDPQFGIHKLIKEIKGHTSRILRMEFKHLTTKLPTLWTNSYFVATVSGAPLSVIKQYIESQKTSQRG